MNRIVLAPEQLDAALARPEPVGPARVACPQCGSAERLKTETVYTGFLTLCDSCYDCDCSGDPAEFRPTSPQGWGMTRAASVEAWNEAVETWEPRRAAE